MRDDSFWIHWNMHKQTAKDSLQQKSWEMLTFNILSS